jgi:hypothetical protein
MCVKIWIKDGVSIQLKVDGTSLTTPYETAYAFSKYIQSVHIHNCSVLIPPVLVLRLPLQTRMFIKLLNAWGLRNLMGLMVPSFAIKSCCEFVPVSYLDLRRGEQCLGTAATNGHNVHPPDDINMENDGGMTMTGGTEELWEKPVPVPFYPP